MAFITMTEKIIVNQQNDVKQNCTTQNDTQYNVTQCIDTKCQEE